MANRKTRRISPYADRMGRFIGQLRDHEGITLEQLSRGLCEKSYLNKIENGDREVGKLMTDAFFQRLGKPVELFERILDHEEFVKWTQRQEMIAHLRNGRADEAESCAAKYREKESCVLDRQFTDIVAINCRALRGASAAELLPMVESALRLTQPDFGKVPFDKLLLSQNEGRLFFAHLQLREEIEGSAAVAEDYRALMRYFKNPRYESRERVYLFPYVACRVIENDFRAGQLAEALSVCEDALAELTREKRLFAYDKLLEWKQKIFDATGNPDKMPGWLLTQLRLMLKRVPERTELLVPCEEQGHVYCINQVIRDRRNLLGLSQEEISDEACGLRSVSRIENEDSKVQRKNRMNLLKKVNMSGERYDYEIISERYEDYLLRSELDRAIAVKRPEEAEELLKILRQRLPKIPVNQQYILKTDAAIKAILPEGHCEKISINEQKRRLKEAIQLTLPLMDPGKIDHCAATILTINEILLLIAYAFGCKRQKEFEESLAIFRYIKNCLENADADISYYEDLYTRVGASMSSVLGNLSLYQESIDLLTQCMRLSLDSWNSTRLAQYPYSIVCCIRTQMSENPAGKDAKSSEQEIAMLLKQAYAATVISGDLFGQKFIRSYYLEMYGEDLKFNCGWNCHPTAQRDLQ